jgi:hypothetical protein
VSYAQVFDVQLAEDSQARGRWNTAQGGSYYAVGVGGALYGRGAHIALIDDPFSSMADARERTGRVVRTSLITCAPWAFQSSYRLL